MCTDENRHRVDRRHLMTGALGVGLAIATATDSDFSPALAEEHGAAHKATEMTPDQALAALKAGNARYVSSPQACTMDLAKQRAAVVDQQVPWATIVSCADSRVPPELLFGGLGIGQLFVARNAGNLVDTATLGTIEYGAKVLGSPLIVVLGHEKCGAVKAACDVLANKATYPGSIGMMIEPIVPAAISVRDQAGDFVDNTVIESAKRTVRRLLQTGPILSELAKDPKKLRIVAARYDLDDGSVQFFE